MRQWNTGLRDDDLSAFITCFDNNGTPKPAAAAVFFTVGDLKATEDQSELGPPKSASEGAERDRTWPSTVPSRSGVVLSVDAETIRVMMDADADRPQRPQTFRLRGKAPYVVAGDRFVAEETILAGLPRRQVRLDSYINNKYEPLADVAAPNPVDRYAAVKALPFRPDAKREAIAAIEQRLDSEFEIRVLLKRLAQELLLDHLKPKSASKLSSGLLRRRPAHGSRADLTRTSNRCCSKYFTPRQPTRALPEMKFARQQSGDRVRQASNTMTTCCPFWVTPTRTWYFMRSRDRSYVPAPVIDSLISELIAGDERIAPSASEVLRLIASEFALNSVIAAVRAADHPSKWPLATLGRFPADKVRLALQGDPLLDRVAPILLLSKSSNWIAEDTVDIDLKFLLKQNF